MAQLELSDDGPCRIVLQVEGRKPAGRFGQIPVEEIQLMGDRLGRSRQKERRPVVECGRTAPSVPEQTAGRD